MGCCLSKCKPEEQTLDEYEGFQLVRKASALITKCDYRYTKKTGHNATFACGSFWRAQAVFSLLPGVLRSRCGFCGGTTYIGNEPDKTADHSQVIDLEFDPLITTYEELLKTFWRIHDPSVKPAEARYNSIIFYHTENQRKEAESSLMDKDREILKSSRVTLRRAFTRIKKVRRVFNAKKEDQQHYLQDDKYLLKVSDCITIHELIYSHLATKLNAFASGFSVLEEFEQQKDELELDDMAVAYMREKIKRYSKI